MSMMPPPVVMTPRKLAVVIIADVSYSMLTPLGDGKTGRRIDALNRGVRELIATCARQPTASAEINIAAITFGNDKAELAMSLTPAADAIWDDMEADGNTPFGIAIDKVVDYLESGVLTTRDWRPILALCSDGQPNDESWRVALARLNASKLGGRADRFAVAIGDDADKFVLNEFVEQALKSSEGLGKVFDAGSEFEMSRFFKAVSWVSTSRSQSTNPNKRPDAGQRTGVAVTR